METFQPRNNTGCHQIEDYTYKVRKDKDTPIGIKKEYSWILEEIPQGDICLAFYVVHQYARVSIDGKVVYSLMPSGENTLCKTVGCNWVMVPLYPEDAGKEILVETIPVYENCKDRPVEF